MRFGGPEYKRLWVSVCMYGNVCVAVPVQEYDCMCVAVCVCVCMYLCLYGACDSGDVFDSGGDANAGHGGEGEIQHAAGRGYNDDNNDNNGVDGDEDDANAYDDACSDKDDSEDADNEGSGANTESHDTAESDADNEESDNVDDDISAYSGACDDNEDGVGSVKGSSDRGCRVGVRLSSSSFLIALMFVGCRRSSDRPADLVRQPARPAYAIHSGIRQVPL